MTMYKYLEEFGYRLRVRNDDDAFLLANALSTTHCKICPADVLAVLWQYQRFRWRFYTKPDYF